MFSTVGVVGWWTSGKAGQPPVRRLAYGVLDTRQVSLPADLKHYWRRVGALSEAPLEEEAMNLITLANFFSLQNKILVFSLLAYASLC